MFTLTHPAKQVLGAVSVLAGIAVAFLVARRLVLDVIVKIWQFGVLIALWRLGLFALVASVALYLIRSGLRMINPRVFGPCRFGWGKILFGVVILYMQLGFDYHFIPRGRRQIPYPSTMNQAVSVLIWVWSAKIPSGESKSLKSRAFEAIRSPRRTVTWLQGGLK